MSSQPLVSNSQHWGEFIVSLLSLSLLLEEKLVTFFLMYEPFEVRFWHQFCSPLLFHSLSKEHWVVIPHFPGSYKAQLQNLLSCSQTPQSSGELLSKVSITQLYKKPLCTTRNQKRGRLKRGRLEDRKESSKRQKEKRKCDGEASKRKRRGQKKMEKRTDGGRTGCCVCTNIASHCFSMHFTAAQSSSIDCFIVFN